MYIVDLRCSAGHEFEGWYDSAAEFRELQEGDELTCPLCGTEEVERVPSATRISTSRTRGVSPPLEVQRALARVVQRVRETHEDVGERFAECALAIHRGEEEPRPIHGTSTPEEEEEMAQEGVPFVKIPVPDIEQN